MLLEMLSNYINIQRDNDEETNEEKHQQQQRSCLTFCRTCTMYIYSDDSHTN